MFNIKLANLVRLLPALTAILFLCGHTSDALARSGPSDNDLSRALQQELDWVEVRSLKTSNRLEQTGLMGTIFDGKFSAKVRTAEPLYVAIEEMPEGTIVEISIPSGSTFTVSGGFIAARDAGFWDIDFKRISYSPRLTGYRADHPRFIKPVALIGSRDADAIFSRRDQRIAEEVAEKKRNDEERARKEEERRQAKLKREAEAAAVAAEMKADEDWEAHTIEMLTGTWTAVEPIKYGNPPKILDYANDSRTPKNACGGPHNLTITFDYTEEPNRYGNRDRRFEGKVASVWTDITPVAGASQEDYTSRTRVSVKLDKKERTITLNPDPKLYMGCSFPRGGASGGTVGINMELWLKRAEVLLKGNTLTAPPREGSWGSVGSSFVLTKER